jgi:hypothetical protein
MTLLRRALSLGALVQVAAATLLLVAPGWLVETALGQTPGVPDVWVRLLGAAMFSLALLHVLIVRKIEELWWWTWAMVAFDGIVAIVAVLHAVVGLEDGSAAWPWWVAGCVSAIFAAVYVAGLARAGQEKPFG